MRRLIFARWKGDVLTAFHVRDYELETAAAAEAVRLHLVGEEPERRPYPLPPIREGQFRDATSQEADHYFRMRVYDHYTRMAEEFARRPARKRVQKAARS